MKINSKYLIINGSIILLAITFVLFVQVFTTKKSNFPEWIIILSFIFLFVSFYSFIKNFKSFKVEGNSLIIQTILRSNKIILIENVTSVEESTFYYGGTKSKLYEGYILEIVTGKRKFKTTSLNEKEYTLLRNNLKKQLKGKVRLLEHNKAENISWIYLVIMNIPTTYLIYKIINI